MLEIVSPTEAFFKHYVLQFFIQQMNHLHYVSITKSLN